ncbi:hypothetical protein F5X99DRAFT_404883 [Biscogniauxia marginata]|nr:hypothetical protein F5X99DRAFT_404883 [Biscogniauxia marginata]
MANETTISDFDPPGLELNFDFAIKYIKSKLDEDFLRKGGGWDRRVTKELEDVYIEIWGDRLVPEIKYRPLIYVQTLVLDGLWTRIFGKETRSPWATLLGLLPVESSSSADDHTAVHYYLVGFAWDTAKTGNSHAALHIISKREVAAAYGYTRYSVSRRPPQDPKRSNRSNESYTKRRSIQATATLREQTSHDKRSLDRGSPNSGETTDDDAEPESAEDNEQADQVCHTPGSSLNPALQKS